MFGRTKTVIVQSTGFSGESNRKVQKKINQMERKGWTLVGSSFSGGFFSNKTQLTFRHKNKGSVGLLRRMFDL